MPIFPRRQLQLMLDELGPWLPKSKAVDLVKRIEHENPDQAIPGEYELGLCWALSKVAQLEMEPQLGGKTPDALSANLFTDQPAVIEVMAMSDDALSGETSMNRTANIINNYANTVRRKASANLHYEFMERRGYRPGPILFGQWRQSQFYRERLTSPNFELTAEHKAKIKAWVANWPPKSRLEIVGEGTVLVMSWKEWVHPQTRVFSSMPSVVHDVVDNPLYARMKEKERHQLSKAPAGYLRIIFLGDAGCSLVRNPNPIGSMGNAVSGRAIIQRFLHDTSIDMVCVFSPRYRHEGSFNFHNNPRLWHLYVFDKIERDPSFYSGLEKIRDALPNPYLHGYQARSWMQQRMLGPQARGQYLPLTIISKRGLKVTAKISARGLLELLAGRSSHAELQRFVLGDGNHFERWLSQGYAISGITFEPKGPDHDDDVIAIDFEVDPNASPLRLPHELLGGKPEKGE